MELYGGGMLGPSSNYQLGGQIASARRGREYQSEIRKLEKKQRAAAKRKKKSGFLGSLGSIAGGALGFALAGPAGAAIGAGLGRGAGESSYARESYKDGKYAQETRGELREAEDDYRKSIGEKMVVDAAMAAIMPGAYEKIGKVAGQGASFLKGIPTALEAGQEMGLTGMQAFGDYAKSFSPSSALAGASYNPMAATLAGVTTPPVVDIPSAAIAPPVSAPPDGLGAYTGTASQNLALGGFEGFDLGGGQEMWKLFEDKYGPGSWKQLAGERYAAMGQPMQLAGMRGGGWIPMMPMGGFVDPQRPNMPMGTPLPNVPMGPPRPNVPMGAGPQLPNVPMGAGRSDPYAVSPMADAIQKGPIKGDEIRDYTPSPTTGGTQDLTPGPLSDAARSALEGFQVFGDDNPVFGEDTDWSGLFGDTLGPTGSTTDPTDPTDPAAGSTGYGTAIGSQSALTQMGMGDVASDPRLQEYLGDLPQFSQGYRQQFGDIQKGGRQSLAQMYAAQRSTGGGFAGSGSGAQAFGQQYAGLMGEQGRQRRGVVEGFQSDLLSGIRDIEQKGEFEFGEQGLEDEQAKFAKMRGAPGGVFANLTDEQLRELLAKSG